MIILNGKENVRDVDFIETVENEPQNLLIKEKKIINRKK